jgi:hypothetical protein
MPYALNLSESGGTGWLLVPHSLFKALLGVIASHKSGLRKKYSSWHPFAATEDLIMVEERD